MSNYNLPPALKEDIRHLSMNPPAGIESACPLESNFYEWHALLRGPTDTMFERGLFRVCIKLDKEYPKKPPQVTFLSEIYHPNIDREGLVCMDILGKNWNQNHRIREILLSLLALLGDPNPNDPANYIATEDFKKHPTDPNYRRKVLEVVEKSEMYIPREGNEAMINYNIVRRDREKLAGRKSQETQNETRQDRKQESSCVIQ